MEVDFRLRVRDVGGVFRTINPPVTLNSTGKSHMTKVYDPPIIVPKNSDIIITAVGSTTGIEVSAGFNSYLATVT